jgi:phosphoglycerate dehydrogenase-like enzyme
VAVTEVRRRDGDGWRARLPEFDWIVLAVPGTPETRGMIGAAEIAAMKPEAVLVNVARGDVVDQPALIAALREKRIAAAVLDVTDPEPLPPGHALWSVPNVHLTMHLSGIPTPASIARAADRFLTNCERFRTGARLEAQIDPGLGY